MSREFIALLSVVAILLSVWLYGQLNDRRFQKNLEKFSRWTNDPTDSLNDLLQMARFAQATSTGRLLPWCRLLEVFLSKDDNGILSITPINGTEPIILRGVRWASNKDNSRPVPDLPGIDQKIRVKISSPSHYLLQVYQGNGETTWVLLGTLDVTFVTSAEVF